MKAKIVNSLKKMRKSIIEYIITNRLFLSYVILALLSTMFVRKYTIGGFFNLYPIITDLGLILIIGALGYFIKPKNQFKYYFFWIIFVTFVCMLSSIYYRFFTSFASVGELATIGQTETVTNSIYDRLKFVDLMYVFVPLAFYYIHKKLSATTYYNFIDKIEKGKKMVISTLLIGVLFLCYTFGVATKSDYSRLSKQWNRLYIVERFGIIMYQFNDLVQFLTPKISSMFGYENAAHLFSEYFDAKEETGKNKYTNILKNKNIVFVHMESIQTFLMDLNINNQEVLPNIKRLAKEGMFFSNFYPQISTGTSSDSEFTLLSGLMPASSGTVFVSYYDRNYLTIPKYLKDKGYYTFSMHGNYASMWNRNKAHPSLGYDHMYYRESFNFTDQDVINLGINDCLFFEQAMPILEQIEANNKNYMGTIITLSNHSPFKLASMHSDIDLSSTYVDPKTNEVVKKDYLSNSAVGEYIKSSNYADKALGEFVDYIKKSKYFNDTIFVFYGDHDAKLTRSEINYLYNLNPLTGDTYREDDPNYIKYDYYNHEMNKKTPLIIWTKNNKLKNTFTGTVNYTMGMYNIAPTILNMYGIKAKYAVGEDIFSVKNNNMVVLANGNIITNNLYYVNSTGEYQTINGSKIDEEYITKLTTEAEKRLEVSNAIITYNLLDSININGEK